MAPWAGEAWEPDVFTGSHWEEHSSERNHNLWNPCGFYFGTRVVSDRFLLNLGKTLAVGLPYAPGAFLSRQ